MPLEIAGKIDQIFEPVTGESRNGAWSKQEFIIQTFDTYPKPIHCSVWGDKIDQLGRFKAGDAVRISINIESREYNGRWYTDIRAWKIDAFQAAPAGAPQSFAQPGSYNPQGGPSYQAPQQSGQPNFQPAPQSGQNFFEGGDDDDLPF
jgi:single-stranded DNA-binding protein